MPAVPPVHIPLSLSPVAAEASKRVLSASRTSVAPGLPQGGILVVHMMN